MSGDCQLCGNHCLECMCNDYTKEKMKKKMSPQQFIDKCNWEGGGLENGFEYGLSVSDLNNSNPLFNESIKKAESFYRKFQKERELIYDTFNFEEQ